jgi:dUTP pyrophosphatase
VELKVKRLTQTAKLPTKAFDYEAGWDFYADERVEFEPEYELRDDGVNLYPQICKIKTGIAIELPREYCLVLKDRSSFGSKGFHILAGVIDSSYRGEILVCMANLGNNWKIIERGEKFAQGLLLPVPVFTLHEVDELSPSVRGELGFGSTGA